MEEAAVQGNYNCSAKRTLGVGTRRNFSSGANNPRLILEQYVVVAIGRILVVVVARSGAVYIEI